ncbi:hypothetical protein HGM15179_013892 [Zosterops borbonicus]|uniref:Uncharacterized protein n=1 Tax=Zosterops borbonicus TaxID=364589 RepID=A0A8K1LGX0_9PASS|nr:hypothetical protein HGM15179_013892 [Zosterops borbonicus]
MLDSLSYDVIKYMLNYGKTACSRDNCPPGLVDNREQNGLSGGGCQRTAELLDVHKSMGADGIHPRVMMELADECVKLLSVIFQVLVYW